MTVVVTVLLPLGSIRHTNATPIWLAGWPNARHAIPLFRD
ncbi:MAG: hypothetical protein J07HX5_01136 [halophilic archaeon J07HX5]|nr:MAG: hypothetical protein J07HX5_01136 [halophilic archaeon J07HX5]